MAAELGYSPPVWARKPGVLDWKLMEIKGGVQVGVYGLTKECVLLGRAADVVDIGLHHESCSRLHARLAFDETGLLWLKDLSSTHGTTVNKKQLPPESIGKTESNNNKNRKGSRGVMVFPGDILQFGASTRLFCLEGPSEFDRGAIQAKLQQQKLQQQQQQPEEPTLPSKGNDQDEVMWGMSMEDNGENETTMTTMSVSEALAKLDSSKIPDRLRKEWERLTAKKHKLHNIQIESDRIVAKGGGGGVSSSSLTHGQEKQLERNKERIEKLLQQVETMEDAFYQSMYPSQPKQTRRRRRKQDAFHDIDDVDDKTLDFQKRQSARDDETTETEESLVAKWKRYWSLSKRQGQTLSVSQARVKELRQQLVEMQQQQQHDDGGGDDEDAFFVRNEFDLAMEEFDKANQSFQQTQRDLDDTERLVGIVTNHKLYTDRTTGYIGKEKEEKEEKPPQETTTTLSMPPPSPKLTTSKPPPPPPPTTATGAAAPNDHMPPPPPLAPPKRSSSSQTNQEPATKKAKTVLGPTAPPPQQRKGPVKNSTLSFLTNSLSSSSSSSSVAATDNNNNNKKKDSSLDGKHDDWRAPKDQDGSGYTKLNAKFAGRY